MSTEAETLPLGTQADSLVDHDIESGGNLRVSISVGTVFNDGMSDDNCDTHDNVNAVLPTEAKTYPALGEFIHTGTYKTHERYGQTSMSPSSDRF